MRKNVLKLTILIMALFLNVGRADRQGIVLQETEEVPDDNNFGVSAFLKRELL